MRCATIAAAALLALPTSAICGEAPVLVSPDGIGRPTIAATADGYALVHWDYGDAGDPGRPEGGLRFVALDASFHPTGKSVPLTIDDRFGLAEHYRSLVYTHVEAVHDGYLLFAQLNGYELDTLALDPDGRPRGESHELVFADELYAMTVAAGSNGFVFSEGCAQTDVFLILRDRKGTGAPIPLAAEAYDEGINPSREAVHPLRVVSAGDRFGVLYRASPRPEPPFAERCFFAEFDASGRPIGAKRELHEEFGLDANDEIAVIYDGRHRRYVLAWGGNGPEGWGTYVLALPPAR